MQQIPLTQIPSQTFSIVLDGQYCTISLYWRQERLYLDLYVNDTAICQGALCQNRVDVVQSKSKHFKGTLHFYDTEGEKAPHWEKLNERYLFIFVEEAEPMPASLMY